MRVSLNEEWQRIWQENNCEYLRYEYDLCQDDLVIDVGAYRGEWAEEISERFQCKLILIEPTPHILSCPVGQIINKAAATYDGVMKFGGAYYYTSAHEDLNTEYECFDINSLLGKCEEVALLKMNIEGGEYDLLDHIIAAGLHTRIRNLQVQFHLIEGMDMMARYLAIAGMLAETHELTWQYPFVWENWSRMDAYSEGRKAK